MKIRPKVKMMNRLNRKGLRRNEKRNEVNTTTVQTPIPSEHFRNNEEDSRNRIVSGLGHTKMTWKIFY